MTIINRSFAQKILVPFMFGALFSAPTRDPAAQNLGHMPRGFVASKITPLTTPLSDLLNAGYRVVSGGLGMAGAVVILQNHDKSVFCAIQFPGPSMMGGVDIGASQCFSLN
jgi:hypothetical protein